MKRFCNSRRAKHKYLVHYDILKMFCFHNINRNTHSSPGMHFFSFSLTKYAVVKTLVKEKAQIKKLFLRECLIFLLNF
jgi:hypothetical protein